MDSILLNIGIFLMAFALYGLLRSLHVKFAKYHAESIRLSVSRLDRELEYDEYVQRVVGFFGPFLSENKSPGRHVCLVMFLALQMGPVTMEELRSKIAE